MIIKADIHLHSCLSPCGDLSMSPAVIADVLSEKGVTLAALTDHNSVLNNPAFSICCARKGIHCLYGMEAQTSEEVHVLTLFSSLETAQKFGSDIYSLMPFIRNKPDKMGDQVYVDEDENILGEVEKYLVTSAAISIEELAKWVHSLGGLVIPAHVDRAAFSLSSQFGFVVDGDWDALEVVRIPSSENTLGYPLTTSSDAHYIEHIARRPFTLDTESLPLLNKDGTVCLETIRQSLQTRPR